MIQMPEQFNRCKCGGDWSIPATYSVGNDEMGLFTCPRCKRIMMAGTYNGKEYLIKSAYLGDLSLAAHFDVFITTCKDAEKWGMPRQGKAPGKDDITSDLISGIVGEYPMGFPLPENFICSASFGDAPDIPDKVDGTIDFTVTPEDKSSLREDCLIELHEMGFRL